MKERQLPQIFKIAHDHGHEHESICSHGHQHNHKVRDKILGKVQNKTVKVAVAGVLRISSLILCPGDDIAAATLVALNQDSHHSEKSATLPARPFFEREVVASNGRKRRYKVGALDDPTSYELEKKEQLIVKFG